MNYLIFINAVIGVLLIYLLSRASANTDLFLHNYYGLLALAGGLSLSLIVLVSYQFWQLVNKIKGRVFGAKLTLRLALFFSLIAILPGALVYTVSVQFLSKSIESWFDVRVEKALEGGLNLGRSTLESSLGELSKKGKFVALLLADKPASQYDAILKRLVAEGATQEVSLFSRQGKLLMFHSRLPSSNSPDLPTESMLNQAVQDGTYSFVDAEADKHLELRVLVLLAPAHRFAKNQELILQFTEPVSQQVSDDEETVQAVYQDYQQLSLSRVGLKRLFGITLTLSLLIVLLSAISAAFFISNRMSSPLAALAEGTRAVAQGDFSRLNPTHSSDELGALTVMFNQMTAQLADARLVSEQQQLQVEHARAYLESVLAHLSSGVLTIDDQFRLRSANKSAVQILGAKLNDMLGRTLSEIAAHYPLLRTFVHTTVQAFAESGSSEWQRQIERLGRNGSQVLLIRGTRLSMAADSGGVVVFDNITHLLQAERQAAWGEVARRLAHEIKNPLTPIQLSAERLEHKLSGKLGSDDAQLLQRATQTIVSQVTALKNMVVEFADYARTPSPKMTTVDMHKLLYEVLGLYEAALVPITTHLDATRFRIKGDDTRLRQIMHNLLQNAQDALQDTPNPEITVDTSSQGDTLRVSVRDNGQGFSQDMLGRAFDPYVTSKLKGTGLGLAIVKKIVEEHGGTIGIENIKPKGTQVSFVLPLLNEDM